MTTMGTTLVIFLVIFFTLGLKNSLIAAEDEKKDDQDKKQDHCYEHYGCFDKNQFFDPVSRVLMRPPNSPEKLNVTFHLFTAKNPIHPFVMTYNQSIDELDNSHFDPKNILIFLVHGWITEFNADYWTGRIIHSLVKKNVDINAIAVDWSRGAMNTNYLQAAADIRLVGRIVSKFVRDITDEYGISPSQVHIIGHSLGAHVSGFVGKQFSNPKIGHITALDPAGPFFRYSDKRKRLDKSDATLVEVHHTDAGHTGTSLKLGHVDIWLNGGSNQPGCAFLEQTSDGVGWLNAIAGGCSHGRSTEYILDTFDADLCQPVAYACDSYDDFKNAKCIECGDQNENCWLYGLGEGFMHQVPDRYGLSYYFNTDKKLPYCLNHYSITLFTNEKQQDAGGQVKVDINFVNEKQENVVVKENFKPLSNYSKIFTTIYNEHLPPIEDIRITWQTGNIVGWGKDKYLNLDKVVLKVMSLWDPVKRKLFTTTFCGRDEAIEADKTATFFLCLKD